MASKGIRHNSSGACLSFVTITMILLKLVVLTSTLVVLEASEHCQLLGHSPITYYYSSSGLKQMPKYVLCQNVDYLPDLDQEIEPLIKQMLIRYVTINDSVIPKVSPGMFKFLQNIPDLRVNAVNLETIELGAFNGTSLRQLNLSNNKLSALKDNCFENLTNLTSLNLSYNSITVIENRAFKGLDNLIEISLQNNRLAQLDPKVFENLGKVVLLNLSRNKLENIDDNLFINLWNLETLWLTGNQLKTLGMKLFVQNLQLQTLNIDENSLTTLALELPISCTTINASHNALTEVNWPNFVQVRVLNLNNNAISSLKPFPDPTKIKELYLDNNYLGLNKLNSNIFNEFVNLEVLRLGANKLTTLDPSLFSNNNRLKTLSLANNYLSALDTSQLPNTLKTLNLSSNNFDFIPNLTTLNQLTVLDASSNNIKKITTNMFANLKSLKTLYLKNNEINEIELGCFRDLNTLWEMDLSNNNISGLEIGIFAGLSRLVNLDVSHNQLTMLNEGVFHSFKNLHDLNFSYNKINYINAKNTLSHFSWMTYVNLEGNDWTCSLLTNLIREIRNVKLREGRANNVTNVNGIACRNENEEAIAIANNTIYTQSLVDISNKLTTTNAMLILIFIVLVAKLIAKCVPPGLARQALVRRRSDQEMQLIMS